MYHGFLAVLNGFLLGFHLVLVRVWWTEFRGKPLECDASSVIEALEVGWGQVAALLFPLLVVDGASLCQALGRMLLQCFVRNEDVDLGLGDVYDLGFPTSAMLHLLDSFETVQPEGLNHLLELGGCSA